MVSVYMICSQMSRDAIVVHEMFNGDNEGNEAKGWTWIFRKNKGIYHATMARESEKDAKLERQTVDAMEDGNGGADPGITEGWQEEKRKNRGSKHESPHKLPSHIPHPIHRNRPHVSDFDKVMRDKATSFFFTNFPDSWDSSALWKMFGRYGKVVDVYIAFKRTKKDTRFGFVRFINTWELEGFERRLKGIIIGDSNLIINRARFNKLGGSDFRASDFPSIKHSGSGQIRRNLAPLSHSFKEAVLGSRQIMSKLITINEDKSIRYVGGLSFLFEWKSKDVAVKNIEDNRVWFQHWFDDIKPWEGSELPVGRLVWLNVEGLPALGRHIGAVKDIVKDFGRVFEVGRLDFDAKILPPVKTLLFVQCMEEIFQSIIVSLNGNIFPVKVYEDRSHVFNLLSSASDADDESSFEEEFVESRVQSSCIKSGTSRNGSPEKGYFSPLPSELPPPPIGPHPAETSMPVEVVQPTLDFVVDGPNSLDVNSPYSIKSNPDLNRTLDLGNDGIDDDKELEDLFCGFERISESIRLDNQTNVVGASGGILTMWDFRVFTMEQTFCDRNFLGITGSLVGMANKVGL
nr:nucleotide-binding alpha-beta plait domain-containing protein [Tanacetum cinerariifolium]